MKRLIQLGCAALFLVVLSARPDAAQAQQPQVVVEGPLTPEHPFGICPATERPRTATDFYQLFGYIPASSGVKYPGVPSSPPKSWPKTYWTPKPHQLAAMKNDPMAAYKLPSSVSTTAKPSAAPVANPVANAAPPATSVASSKPVPTHPQKNTSPKQSAKPLTPSDAAEMKRQLAAQQTKLLDDIGRRVASAPSSEHRDALQKAIETARTHVANGALTGQDVADLTRGIQNALPQADQGPALNAAAQMAANEQVSRWLAGNGGAPTSGNTAGAVTNNAANPGTGGRLGMGNSVGGAGGNPSTAANPGTGGRLGMNNAAGGAGGKLGAGNAVGGAGPNRSADPGTGGRLGMANAAGGAGRSPLGANNAAGGAGQGNNFGGGNAPIGLIPGLPAGLMIPLPFAQGGGAFLFGMGQPGGEILLGTGDPDQVAGLLVAPPDAPPAPAAADVPSTGDIVVGNAASGPVRFVVNQTTYTLQAQQEQTFPAGTRWTIEFDRGSGRGTARYQLDQGYNEFRFEDNVWGLFRKQFATKLDNVGGATPFHYVIDNRTQTLGAGEKQDLSGIYAPVVRFNDSTGNIKQRRLTADHYRVALATDGTLDVFPADSVPLPVSASSVPSIQSTPAFLSVSADSSRSSATSSLPPGFQLFDTRAAITATTQGSSLPPGFSLFKDIAAVQ